MSDSTIKRGLQESIDNQPITDGKIYLSTDQCRLFMDIANERLEFSDFIRGLTYNEIINLESPLPKIYLSTDTLQMLSYDFVNKRWIPYTGGGSVDPVVIAEMQEEINEMKETLQKYERVIQIIEEEYNLNN